MNEYLLTSLLIPLIKSTSSNRGPLHWLCTVMSEKGLVLPKIFFSGELPAKLWSSHWATVPRRRRAGTAARRSYRPTNRRPRFGGSLSPSPLPLPPSPPLSMPTAASRPTSRPAGCGRSLADPRLYTVGAKLNHDDDGPVQGTKVNLKF